MKILVTGGAGYIVKYSEIDLVQNHESMGS